MPTLKPTKKFKMFSLVSLAYLIFIISLGISYAYLSSNLQITGVASIDGYVWPEGVLPTEPVETTEGTQFSTTFQSDYLTIFAIKFQIYCLRVTFIVFYFKTDI